MTTAIDHKRRLELLVQERCAALSAGLGDNSLYMDRLEDELTATLTTWIGAAVTEIASLRAQLDGPLQG